jgi:anti-repressor protein
MNEIIISSNDGRMSSLEIANLTGKEHKNVMRDIRNLLDQGVAALNFELGQYKDANQQDRPCYNLTKKGCLILASGYDAKLREKIIDRWEQLETERQTGGFQIPQSYSQALLLAAKQAEKIEQQQKQLQQQAPKVLFADSVSASHTSILIGDLAKILKQNGVEIGAKRLFVWMRRNGYLIKQPGMSYNMPSQRGMNLNLFEIKETVVTHSDGHTSINKTVKVTGTGQIYFVNKFLKQKELV